MRVTMLARVTTAALVGAVLSIGANAAPLTVSDGWFRTLPGALPAAGYFTVKNTGTTTVSLTGAATPGCGQTMLHMTHNMNGMMHMMAVEKVDVPAGGATSFASGGYHLMCMEPKLQAGTSVPVTLRFSDGSVVTTEFAVRAAGAN